MSLKVCQESIQLTSTRWRPVAFDQSPKQEKNFLDCIDCNSTVNDSGTVQVVDGILLQFREISIVSSSDDERNNDTVTFWLSKAIASDGYPLLPVDAGRMKKLCFRGISSFSKVSLPKKFSRISSWPN